MSKVDNGTHCIDQTTPAGKEESHKASGGTLAVKVEPLVKTPAKFGPSKDVEIDLAEAAHHCTDQVMDGERGNEYRKQLLPAYKSNRNAFVPLSKSHRRETWKGDDADLREAFPRIKSFLKSCGIPVVSLEDAEADDVVASLTEQAVCKGFRVTIASPDKDFKQLICENVQLVVPLTGCLLGDKVDCIPGLAEFAPGFGRKTALKLLKKHGSLERLLREASTRTVGKPFVQDALTQHAPALWKNREVLRLRRDLPVCLVEEWCVSRKSTNDEKAFSELEKHLKALRDQRVQMDGVRTKYVAKRLVVGKISES
ncbi:hypothetical protein L7F22_018255 [Adiantum nelumboides]|nr:hypothetical protein [Adiantum nelumboides]